MRGNRPANAAAIRALMPAGVARGDRSRFVALVEAEFESLHEGNAVRFGLTPAEFTAWHKRRQRRGA